jgi:hypothetical protein
MDSRKEIGSRSWHRHLAGVYAHRLEAGTTKNQSR